jgi:hypothetical protein
MKWLHLATRPDAAMPACGFSKSGGSDRRSSPDTPPTGTREARPPLP